MKLVEAEAVGPVEGDDALVTPPRPPHRRVSVSLLFTASVLIGTVVTIYAVFPPRDNVLVTEAIAQHRDSSSWELTAPTEAELRAWAIGVVGSDPPLPAGAILGARHIQVFHRGVAVIRVKVGGDDVTYVIQRARGIAPDHRERDDGDLHAIEWRRGAFACIAVGPAASAATWAKAIGAP